VKASQLKIDKNGATILAPLHIPFMEYVGEIDAKPFGQQATGEIPIIVPPLFSSTGIQALHKKEGDVTALIFEGRFLYFVSCGQLDIILANGSSASFLPGDMLLTDEFHPGLSARISGNGHLLRLNVPPFFLPEGKPFDVSDDLRINKEKPNLKRMYTGADDRSRFREFPELFASPEGKWTALKPVYGFIFVSFEPDAFIDWHPEVTNNMVLTLTGEIELEVPLGDTKLEAFRAGDVCLAEDRTGEGHIDRMRGDTRLALVLLDNRDLW
jgi:hypothetical protein